MARIQQVVSAFPASADVGPWLHHDFYQCPFNLTLQVSTSPTLNANFDIEYVADNFMEDAARPVGIDQSGTTVTVTDSGPNIATWAGYGLTHGLVSGDWVQIRGVPGLLEGGYEITVTDATHYTLTSETSQTLNAARGMVHTARITTASEDSKIIVLAEDSPRPTYTVSNPIVASRLKAKGAISGFGILTAIQGGNLGGRI